MAVILTDNRTVISQADTLTGWTSGDSIYTSAPSPVETTGSIGVQVSNETRQTYFTRAGIDMSAGTLFYAWGLPGGVLDTIVNGGIALIIGDGTNIGAYHVGGADVAGFRHDNGPVFWQCYVLDTGNLPASVTTVSGNPASINLSSVTNFGIQYKTLVKSVGGQENCFIDIMRVGNNGITVTGGSVGDPGLFLEIASEDRQTGNLQAQGVFRELGSDLFGAQGPLFFGDAAGTSSSYFEDTNISVAFEDRNQTVDKYRIVVQSNATGSTTFILGSRTAEGEGTDGCTIIAAEGVGAEFIANDANVETVALYATTLGGFSQGVNFSSDATNAPNHEIFSSTFTNSGQIDVGLTEFKNNSIINSVATEAVRLISTTNVNTLEFVSGGTGHAVLIDTPGTYDFNEFTYSGYATVDGSTGNEAFYNNSGGLVTINVSGGEVPTVRNGAGATTDVVATVNITVTGLRDNTEVRVYTTEDDTPPYSTPTELAGVENATAGTVDDRSFTFSATPNDVLYIRTFNTNWIADDITYTVPNNNANFPIAQRRDRVFSNP